MRAEVAAAAKAAPLYTGQVLAAATGLARFPLAADLPLTGQARSRSCGSTLTIGLKLDSAHCIADVGCQAQACAIGQAAAYLFCQSAKDHDRTSLAVQRSRLAEWLFDPQAAAPDWPDIALLDRARSYPARHGAILLAWDAALDAFAACDPLASPLLPR